MTLSTSLSNLSLQTAVNTRRSTPVVAGTIDYSALTDDQIKAFKLADIQAMGDQISQVVPAKLPLFSVAQVKL